MNKTKKDTGHPDLRKKKTFTAHVVGNGEIQIRLNKSLESAIGQNVAGVLRIENQTIFLPKNGELRIGSGRNCHIRIIGSDKIGKTHATITMIDGQATIKENIDGSEIGIKDKDLPIRAVVTKFENILEGTSLADTEKIIIPIEGRTAAGTEGFLSIGVELEKTISRSLDERFSLAQAAEKRPEIKTVAPPEGEQAEAPVVSQAAAAEPAEVLGANLTEAKSVNELFDLYFIALKEAHKHVTKRSIASIAASLSSVSIGVISAASLNPFLPIGTAENILGLIMAGVGILGAIGSQMWLIAKTDSPIINLKEELCSVLLKLESDKLANALADRSIGERESILVLLDKEDSVKATKLRAMLVGMISGPKTLPAPAQSESADQTGTGWTAATVLELRPENPLTVPAKPKTENA